MPQRITDLGLLLQHNEVRRKGFLARPFFEMVRNQTLDDPRKRKVFLGHVRRFSSNFQRLLFLRQGMCTDPAYYPAFLSHLEEEFGHDKLLEREGTEAPSRDTLFEAILGWFNYQMIALDNAERAALMHLVLEEAGDAFHTLAAPRLGPTIKSPYFDAHAELDAGHAQIGQQLLDELPPRAYQRIANIIDEGWDMMEAITERVYTLVTTTPESDESP